MPAFVAGSGLTVTIVLSVIEQPCVLTAVIKYFVVTVGDAITTAPDVVFKPVAGLHT